MPTGADEPWGRHHFHAGFFAENVIHVAMIQDTFIFRFDFFTCNVKCYL